MRDMKNTTKSPRRGKNTQEDGGEESIRRGVQVISRAAAILRALEDKPQGLSLGEIAKEVQLARSTVQRIVGALAEERLLIAASPKARVRLGPGLVSLGSAASFEFGRIVRPHLEKLSREVEETVDLGMLERNLIVFVDQVPVDTHRLQAVSAVGLAFPLYCCSSGKALLAAMDDEEVETLLGSSLEAFTPNTITDMASLRQELQKIRRTGIAYDREEYTLGISAVGARIKDSFGRSLALSIPAPSVRFKSKEKLLLAALKKYVSILEAALGAGEEGE